LNNNNAPPLPPPQEGERNHIPLFRRNITGSE
jgi:hypothetical protein